MTKYFKGTTKKTGHAMIFAVYDKPTRILFDEPHLVEASRLEQTGIKSYKTIEDCLKENYMSHQISENEYECFKLIQNLLTEIYLHDYTGGFPRKENVLSICNSLPYKVKEWLKEVF